VNRSARAFFAALVALALPFVAAAAPKRLQILNQGNAAILYVRIGNAAGARWGPDLLGYAGAIDVGRGVDVTVDLDDATCTYDVSATFDDGTTQIAPAVNLCTTDRVSFYQPLPVK
jgi:hypothetical protein